VVDTTAGALANVVFAVEAARIAHMASLEDGVHLLKFNQLREVFAATNHNHTHAVEDTRKHQPGSSLEHRVKALTTLSLAAVEGNACVVVDTNEPSHDREGTLTCFALPDMATKWAGFRGGDSVVHVRSIRCYTDLSSTVDALLLLLPGDLANETGHLFEVVHRIARRSPLFC
jgi:hypothetical protein